jgi:hypothetical protein
VNRTQETKNSKFASNVNPASIKNKGLHYICQSPSHRQFNCPLRGGQATSDSQPSASARTPASRTFACAVDSTVTGPIRDGPTGAITDIAVATRAASQPTVTVRSRLELLQFNAVRRVKLSNLKPDVGQR